MNNYLKIMVWVCLPFVLLSCSKENAEVTIIDEEFQLSRESNFDINAPSISQPLWEAFIIGKVKNNSDKPVKNIVIKYKILNKIVTAKVSHVPPDGAVKFTTSKMKTKDSTPPYNLESLEYE